jgi:hypothetical protein
MWGKQWSSAATWVAFEVPQAQSTEDMRPDLGGLVEGGQQAADEQPAGGQVEAFACSAAGSPCRNPLGELGRRGMPVCRFWGSVLLGRLIDCALSRDAPLRP